jgi:hypothetical protein
LDATDECPKARNYSFLESVFYIRRFLQRNTRLAERSEPSPEILALLQARDILLLALLSL